MGPNPIPPEKEHNEIVKQGLELDGGKDKNVVHRRGAEFCDGKTRSIDELDPEK